MASVSPPPFSNGYASPASYAAASPPPASKHTTHSKPKPVNVFSNDGSFLERFQHIKKDEEEKKKQEDILARKRTFDERFKRRGKRPSPDATHSEPATEPASKKPKVDAPLNQYEKQVKSYTASLKDNGAGVRPLVK
ncbi:hypothetical protein DAEQUDRAFT_767358 [Daedalea quercina L-15889]|uniref:Uncharacterized protein n=1 Tax=Daedalea quercina L-15889 TaxID=1314783 RepID=A0A165NS35_9APHY|nr:hypothetical protein DAEQUDRAFT_767358 [Daedalea quercina L-15889]